MTERRLAAGQIDLWVVRPDDITDARLLQSYLALLTPDELARQQRYRFAKDRHSALITRAFVRTLLSSYADIPPPQWRFSKGHNNKPEIINPPLPLRFNLSHAQGLIICAVTLTHDIGVDVEYTARRCEAGRLANRYFSPWEAAELHRHTGAEQTERFFDYWTLKESYIKACGDGLTIPLAHFGFTINRWNDIRIAFAPQRNDHPAHWQSWLLQGTPQHRIAISIRDPQRAPYTINPLQTTPLLGYHPVTLPLA